MRVLFRVWLGALGLLALDWVAVQWVKTAMPGALLWLWWVGALCVVVVAASSLVYLYGWLWQLAKPRENATDNQNGLRLVLVAGGVALWWFGQKRLNVEGVASLVLDVGAACLVLAGIGVSALRQRLGRK